MVGKVVHRRILFPWSAPALTDTHCHGKIKHTTITKVQLEILIILNVVIVRYNSMQTKYFQHKNTTQTRKVILPIIGI